MKLSDSQWHKQLSKLPADSNEERGIYWLWPFKNYKTFCPYLVGSREQVSDELVKYLAAGFRTFILDIPWEESDLHQTKETFALAERKYRQRLRNVQQARVNNS